MKKWLPGLFVIVAISWMVVLMRLPQATSTVEVIDYVTGLPVTNATVEIAYAWTTLPLDEIPFLQLRRWTYKQIIASNGVAKVPAFPKRWSLAKITAPWYTDVSCSKPTADECEVPGVYRLNYFGGSTLHELSLGYARIESNKVTVSLEPQAAGSERAGVRCSLTPRPGSKATAKGGLARIFRRKDVDPATVRLRSCEFFNGYWAICTCFGTIYIVSEDGELLDTISPTCPGNCDTEGETLVESVSMTSL